VGHWCPPRGNAFAPDGRRVATGGGLDGTVRVWDLATGASLVRIARSPEWERGVAFSPDGRSLYTAWTDENVWVCDAATGERRHVLKIEDPERPDTRPSPLCMQLSGDGKKLVAFSHYIPKNKKEGIRRDSMLITGWDTATRKQLFRRKINVFDFELTLSGDGRVLAVPSDGPPEQFSRGAGPMRLEDVETGELMLTFPVLKGSTFPQTFSPDGRLLAAENADGERNTLRLWETATTAEVLVLPAARNQSSAFSADGRLLALATPGQEILVWDLSRGRELRRFKGFDAQVTLLAFSPDDRKLLSGLDDSSLLVWDVGPRGAVPRNNLGAAGVAKVWADLAGTDAPRAFRARWALASSPAEALALLKGRLRRAQPPDAKRLQRLLADLGSDQFAVRSKAQADLEELGDLAEPALRKALAEKPTLEVSRRVQKVLERLRGPVTRPELLRPLRAVAVLEEIATPAAREVLAELASGAPEGRLTREARTSLSRLDRRTPAFPRRPD